MKSNIHNELKAREDNKRNRVINTVIISFFSLLVIAYIAFQIIRPLDTQAYEHIRISYHSHKVHHETHIASIAQ